MGAPHHRNAQTLSTGMEVRPGWAVGWFFIPFASLYKPFQGLDQTWRVSIDPTRWRGLDTPSLLRWWWGFHLTSNIAGSLSNIVGKGEGSVVLLSTAIAIMSFVAGFIASALAIRMIRRLTAVQTALARGRRLHLTLRHNLPGHGSGLFGARASHRQRGASP